MQETQTNVQERSRCKINYTCMIRRFKEHIRNGTVVWKITKIKDSFRPYRLSFFELLLPFLNKLC